MVKTCNDFGCNYSNEVGPWANIPDDIFRDNVRHVCYLESWECPESPNGNWVCPTQFKCPALEQTELWLGKAKNETDDKQFWYDIAVASHYFHDSHVFFHRVQKEGKCHSAFEKAIDNKIDAKETGWSVTVCDVQETYDNLVAYTEAYNMLLENELGLERKQDTPLVERPSFWQRFKEFLGILFQ